MLISNIVSQVELPKQVQNIMNAVRLFCSLSVLQTKHETSGICAFHRKISYHHSHTHTSMYLFVIAVNS